VVRYSVTDPEKAMNLSNDHRLTIEHLSPLIRRRKLSPVELTEFVLDRIPVLQPRLNAFITITAERALTRARQAEREITKGNYRGSLHGIPVCLKDIFHTRGIRTTAGSRILRAFTPDENACVVERLEQAGTVLVGKTNLHEFAFGATNVNPHYGSVHNPWLHGRISGGSSGGSAAAVVAGLAVASLGTDTGGSVRIPAAACGCVGLKPTYGRVPLHGVIPLATSLDHVGPICRSVVDAALMLEAISGADPRDITSTGAPGESLIRKLDKTIRGLRIGVPKQYFFDRLQPEVRSAVFESLDQLENLGAELPEINLRSMNRTADLAAEITVAEALAYHWNWLQKRASDYGSDLRSRMESSADMPAVTYLHAQRSREAYRRLFLESMQSVDLVAAPTLPVTAPPIESRDVRTGRSPEDVRLALLRLTRPGNLTGLPAISVPCGFSSEGLPVGLQLIGKPFEERTVLQAAYSFEQATEWHRRFPPDSPDSPPVAPEDEIP
jgi:aspartyl-tRNA(Asn)/glutamyl-tRNA(Gln) amidotransferase subunit A